MFWLRLVLLPLVHYVVLLQVNRCVRCANSGTFSLNPNKSCQPCVLGGNCTKGLLQPAEGYYMHSPFVPQVLPCPLLGACVGTRQAAAGMQQAPNSHSHSRSLLAACTSTGCNISRSEALFKYNQALAENLTQDPTLGPPMLLNLSYKDMMDQWQGLQCAPG